MRNKQKIQTLPNIIINYHIEDKSPFYFDKLDI